MELNPYESPDADAAKPPTTTRRDAHTRTHLEFIVACAVTMLLAGSWAGARYQGKTFFIVLLFGTVGVLIAAIAYALLTKRLGALLALPLFVLAVIAKEVLAGLFLLGAGAGVLITLLFAVARSTRRNWMRAALAVVLAGTPIGAAQVYFHLRSLGAQRAAKKGDLIVAAISRYQVAEGEWPATLEDLFPRELESIPETGMIGFPTFKYVGPAREAVQEEERLFATYELRVELYKFLQFDSLVYWPEGNYPDFMYGGWVERIGDWAYVHE